MLQLAPSNINPQLLPLAQPQNLGRGQQLVPFAQPGSLSQILDAPVLAPGAIRRPPSSSSNPIPILTERRAIVPMPSGAAIGLRLLPAPVIIPGVIRRPISSAPLIIPRLMLGLRLGVLPSQIQDMSKQRILLINLYLNQIFNTILLSYIKKKKDPRLANLTIKSTYRYKDPANTKYAFNFPDPIIDETNYKKVISKINTSLDEDKLISLTSCKDESANVTGGRLNKNKNIIFNYPLRRKQKTIKKKIRNIQNKNSLKHKIKNKINKCIKKCIRKNSIQQEKKETQKQEKNKVRIKKLLESKIHEKINKLKLNKTKNLSKNKSHRCKNTRKNYE
jgi:hypothetical protein